jgi:ABC-type phosphate/phosphonate transport system substrate-binding protein
MSWPSLLLVVLAFGMPAVSARAAEKPVALAIVNPGGPDAGSEGDRLAAELAAHLAAAAGIEPAQVAAAYFNQLPAATAYLKKHKDAFVLGGLGVFLAQRQALKLVPLARLVGKDGSHEEFTVVVRKGRYGSLAELRGKALHGSVLADDPRFVDRFVFGGKLKASEYFRCTPSERPLSALRKLGADEIDAVLLNRVQLEALRAMPLFEKLQVVHRSGSVPTVGLMMAATPRTRALRDRIVQAVTKLCGTERGAPVCKTYGITGFEPMREDTLGEAIEKYEAP